MKKIPWKYILLGIVGLVLPPLLPLLVSIFISYKIYKSGTKRRWVLIVLTALIGLTATPRWIELFPNNTGNSSIRQQKEVTEIKETTPSTNTATEQSTQPQTAGAAEQKEQPNQPTREKTTVTKVIDGDTIEITDGLKVRYIGMDTPEISGTVECYGQEAANKNKELVEGKEIEMEKDVSETDKYGRLLRYIYLDGKMINESLLKEGYAKIATYPPDVKYQNIFLAAEQEARNNSRGLWGNLCNPTKTEEVEPTIPQPIIQNPSASYTCNCSKTCTQMSSCEEAYYQLNTCGCLKRDGDDDGIPCESICN